ncbi:MAG TPA: polysaccharide biosynthesis/export family protein [Longimicrobiales bacterium]
MCRVGRTPFLILLAGLLLASTGRAQSPDDDWSTARLQMTREGLERLLAQYDQAARSGAYSDELRARARYEAALIRTRLEHGDFQVGDRIVLEVLGEEMLTDSFTVAMGRVLRLPLVGDISLKGVLRSELESYLTQQIGRYLKDPQVRARSLIRISVTGAVSSPGFYVVPSESLLTDVLMMAGGPGQNADLDDIRVERGDDEIWEGDPLQQAITEGRTLDQLSLQAGDRIIVPANAQRNWLEVARIGVFVIPGIIGLFRLF